MERLPPLLEEKCQALARRLGRPVVVRGIQTPDPWFRGRLRVQLHRVLIEYQIAEHGYFWSVPIIETLLARAAAGESEADLRESPSPPCQAPPEQ
jgi:hypothetical protein